MQVRDEVCGMEFAAQEAAATFRLQHRVYYFCGERCKRLFVERPERYVNVTPDDGRHAP